MAGDYEDWPPLLDITDEEASSNIIPEVTPKQQVAVALKHERANKETPKIVASGRGAVAEQILQIAFANGVKVREDAELVEVLSYLDVDSPIPLEAFAAVAEILAYVYKANANARKER